MKSIIKIIVFFVSLLTFMLIFPAAVIIFSPDDFGMGLFLLLFFIVYPLISALLGGLAGSDIRRLWWMPIVLAAIFPLLFSIVVLQFVWDLYLYSVIYATVGIVFMLITSLILKIMRKFGRQKNEK